MTEAHRMLASPRKRATILLVEDDAVDIQSFRRAMTRTGMKNQLVIANDGVEALERLRGETSCVSKPYLIVLDLNLPRMSGIELLRELRNDENLQDSVVFVLTTSCAEGDKLQAYHLNVAGYIVKSEPNDELVSAANLLHQYHQVVELP